MNKFGVLSAAAGLALVLPLAVPSASFAQARIGGGGGGGGAHVSMGGGGAHVGGGGGGAAFHSGGSFRGGGGGFAAAARPVGAPAATIGSGGRSFATAAPSGNWSGNWNGGHNWHGGHRWYGHRHGGFWPGVAAGATIGALGSYAYYGGGYYDPYYYDDGYYDDGAVVAVGPGGDDSVAYCQQRFKSYDPASGTYLGYDGRRHPCY